MRRKIKQQSYFVLKYHFFKQVIIDSENQLMYCKFVEQVVDIYLH